MPYNDPDPTDPNVLVGVVLPADAEAMREMAYVFAEEFARMGVDREHLLSLFKDPFYAGSHGAYRALGEEVIQSIIDECLGAWGQAKFSILDFGREPQSNDFGFSIEEGFAKDSVRGEPACRELSRTVEPRTEILRGSQESKIGNLKSKMVEGRGRNG